MVFTGLDSSRAPCPGVVEFFSRDCKRQDYEMSLEQQVHEITGVTISALQGAPLSHFGVDV